MKPEGTSLGTAVVAGDVADKAGEVAGDAEEGLP